MPLKKFHKTFGRVEKHTLIHLTIFLLLNIKFVFICTIPNNIYVHKSLYTLQIITL